MGYLFYPLSSPPPFVVSSSKALKEKKIERKKILKKKDVLMFSKNTDKYSNLDCQTLSVSLEDASEAFDMVTKKCSQEDNEFYDKETLNLYLNMCDNEYPSEKKRMKIVNQRCKRNLLKHRERYLNFINRNLPHLDAFNWKFIERMLNEAGLSINSHAGRELYRAILIISDGELRKKLTYLYLAPPQKILQTPEGVEFLENGDWDDIFDIEETVNLIFNSNNMENKND